MKRIMVFIDGNNFESAVTNLFSGNYQRIDYGKLAHYIADIRNGHLQRLYYYTAMSSHDKSKAAATKKFIDTLNKHVPYCIAKAGYLKYVGQDGSGKDIYIEKGTDVNIAVDLVSLAYHHAYDEAILLSADTDYEPAIRVVQQLGKNVVACLVDQQKAGYLKDLCDDHFFLKKEDFEHVQR
ncbi:MULTISPECIES: NYN domain-containing protein [Anoxybacillus]|uniref:Uncharacterized LabA/DUF88 family protein n=3 Tax=Anoxybacillus TaxID=150247 RepID=A0A7X0DA49_9BACL|nr:MULTISPECIES: NYN domain-containing protein [Anoxybacillus]MBB5354156.1 uncharacterized LabA/DUF88 family protein [Anoxybacillus mongoliensis]MBB6177348.1 uncharacterized LabA/DUF88 family protein [Anoxybacillus tengchongensis]EMI09452.1 hypothetical protein F510_2493 [Anoxybacillus gonensis]MCQ5365340.1 NYN domain-containing protein [Anoxybacillus gonensis]MCX8002019.1 NYN domain-containing protein [Anoxybacillus mongoliensis]